MGAVVGLSSRVALALVFCAGLLPALVRADVFVLGSGGRLEGVLINPDQEPRREYVIRTGAGGQITLAADRVAEVIADGTARALYERILPRMPQTVEGNLQMAAWCRDNHLSDQSDRHLEQVLALDPDNLQARSLLGYVRQDDGAWLTRQQYLEADGRKLYQGRYRTQQEIELLEAARKKKLAEREWTANVRRWREELANPRRAEQALAKLLEIRDPLAVPAVSQVLSKETDARAVDLLFEVLAHIGSPEAMQILLEHSMDNIDEELRLTALDHVIDAKASGALAYYVDRLQPTASTNLGVNRAAEALALLEDERAIKPLIAALVTEHKYQVIDSSNVGGGNGQQYSQTFGTGSAGHSFGGGGPKFIRKVEQNHQVLKALSKLTGQNFYYDQVAWVHWFNRNRSHPLVDGRRD